MNIFKRKAYQSLLDWKTRSQGSSAIMLDGARRVGKTCLAMEFAKKEYRTFIIVDFSHADSRITAAIRDNSADIDAFFNCLSLVFHTRLYKRQSLIIFDEVQLFPLARQMIKVLVADGRYDYLETGSLISLKLNVQDILIPSEEEHLDLHPMDFEEFRWAMGDDVTVDITREHFSTMKPMGREMLGLLMERYYEYLLVGGMPQAVDAYLKNHDFGSADSAKRTILRLYRDDIGKFAKGYESKVRAIFDAIPEQLSRKEKKYRLSSITKAARFREYEDAFTWLDDARIVNPCLNAMEPNAGLGLSLEHSTQKLYMSDTGLLITQNYNDGRYVDNQLYHDIFFGKAGTNNGMVIENGVAQAFRSAGRHLYFYSRANHDNRKNEIEIDFLIRRSGKICPVEVKSSSYQKHSSLDKFRGKFGKSLGESFILYTKDVMVKDGIVHLPLPMAMLL